MSDNPYASGLMGFGRQSVSPRSAAGAAPARAVLRPVATS